VTSPDRAALTDLATFAAIEMDSRDVEPWADLLAFLYRTEAFDLEAALWLVKLYNAYDDLGSAWAVYRRWPTPRAWYVAPDLHEAADYPCTNERRNLRAGKVVRHLSAYAGRVGHSQASWIASWPMGADHEQNWRQACVHLRGLWGVGRQTAFEWAEFLAKVVGCPLAAPDADLWESEGPRRSLQRLYGEANPDRRWLNARAEECRAELADAGTPLEWVDFETIICDFNVMRDGRYYPGKHLAALRAEIDSVHSSADHAVLTEAFEAMVPAPWSSITAGVDKAKQSRYRDQGVVLCSP
jgi:hypothetical protein